MNPLLGADVEPLHSVPAHKHAHHRAAAALLGCAHLVQHLLARGTLLLHASRPRHQAIPATSDSRTFCEHSTSSNPPTSLPRRRGACAARCDRPHGTISTFVAGVPSLPVWILVPFPACMRLLSTVQNVLLYTTCAAGSLRSPLVSASRTEHTEASTSCFFCLLV